MIVLFYIFLWKLHTVFHSDCTNLHFYERCTRVPFSTQSCQHVSLVFLIMAILTTVSSISWCFWNFPLMISDVECLFMCLLAICISSLEKCLFRLFAHFWNVFLFCFLLSCMRCLYILDINPLSVTQFSYISSHSVDFFSFCCWFPLLCKTLKFN